MKAHVKKILKIMMFSMILLLINTIAHSQPGGRMREKIESQKIAFITDQLRLTPQEAQTFWPLYNERQEKREAENKAFFQKYGPEQADLEEMTDKEAMEMADAGIIHEQKMLDIDKEYHARFKAVLPPKKIVKLQIAEIDFKKFLLKKIEDRRPGGHKGM